MKKLMFAAAAIAAGVAMADVTSANVVGYQGKSIEGNMYNFMVATFERVDGKTPTLADIVPNDEYIVSPLSFLKPDTAGTKYFDIPGFGGQGSEFCYYFEADLEGGPYEGKPGWYFFDDGTGDIYPMNHIEVPFGSMFYLQGADEGDPQIVFNGQVCKEETPVDIIGNMYNFTGNCTPVDLTLGDIGVNEDYIVSPLSFSKPDTAGTKYFDIPGFGGQGSEFCYYFAADLEGGPYEGKPGWYFFDDGTGDIYPMNHLPIPAGSMFYLQGADEGNPQVIIPSAL